jgi:rfaE bifunctional protein kinase chain/domain
MPTPAPRLTPQRYAEIGARFDRLRILVVGDFCLDRYFEIDPARAEISLETGLTVHNVVNTRCQPGGAGTIVNNLSALGVGTIWVAGFCGDDGEGFELRRALAQRPGVDASLFLTTTERKTFCYSKPLVLTPGKPPEELNRLDTKNWSPTPATVSEAIIAGVTAAAAQADAVIVLDQVDIPETGVITSAVLEAVGRVAAARPSLPVLGDSRQGLKRWPPLSFKMNARELGLLTGRPTESLDEAASASEQLATANRRPAFVTLAERGILAAEPGRPALHAPALPVRGPIDVVGAGDSVTANLAAALAAGATVGESLHIAMAAANTVVHQLGTTGAATRADIHAAIA